jgi:Fic family protein
MLESYPVTLGDTIAELVREATTLGSRLHPSTAASLSELVRVMNCYYSNLIEGHNTRPRDIERALANQLEAEPERRDLQVEARAHVRVQSAIDAMFLAGTLGEPAEPDHIRWLHRSFYKGLPPSMLRIRHERGDFDMVVHRVLRHTLPPGRSADGLARHRDGGCPPIASTTFIPSRTATAA